MPEFVHSGEGKKSFTREMFNAIAGHYDFLNHLLSLGFDFYWRHKLVRSIPYSPELKVLDVATQMLRLAAVKTSRRGINNFRLLYGDAEQLPFSATQFPVVTIAFGLRNVGHSIVALQEFHRVLVKGGRLFILEFAKPVNKLFGKIFRFYFKVVLPRIGALFSQPDAYRYLPESVEQFISRQEISELLEASGFENVHIRNLTFGVVTLIVADKQ